MPLGDSIIGAGALSFTNFRAPLFFSSQVCGESFAGRSRTLSPPEPREPRDIADPTSSVGEPGGGPPDSPDAVRSA